jgi:hypothetical protein
MTATTKRALLGVISLLLAPSLEARYEPEVVVADPYIELRTGPGRGYPIFYVAAQGDHIRILKERTEWYKVRTPRGKEGWVDVEQMRSTLDLNGESVDFPSHDMDDFENRRLEVGFGGGDFGGAALVSLRGAYALTSTLSTELTASQILGDYSDGWMGSASIVMTPFPSWRIAPFFNIGTGVVHIEPQTTVVQAEDRTDEVAHVGLGANIFLSRRFILRMEYRRHTVLTSRDENEEIDEWKAGFSVFL